MSLKVGGNGQLTNIIMKNCSAVKNPHILFATRSQRSEQSQPRANLEATYAEMHSLRRMPA